MGQNKTHTIIIGLYGCSCHPFTSWLECEKLQRQKLKIGQVVKHRCSGKIGTVLKLADHGYVDVKFGKLPRDIQSEHAQNLIIIIKQDLK